MLISEKARFFEFFHAEKAIPPQGMPVPPQAPEIFGSHAPKNKKVRPKKSGGRRSPNRRGGYYPPVIAIFRNHTVGAAISRLRLSVFRDGRPVPYGEKCDFTRRGGYQPPQNVGFWDGKPVPYGEKRDFTRRGGYQPPQVVGFSGRETRPLR